MSFIIGKSCVDCMDTACASACPVDCIAADFKDWEIIW